MRRSREDMALKRKGACVSRTRPAATQAAAFDGRLVSPGMRVGVILTAGNVDLSEAAKWIATR